MSIDLLWLLTLLLSKLTINKEYKKELKQLLGISSSPLRLQISDFFNLLSKHIKKNKKKQKVTEYIQIDHNLSHCAIWENNYLQCPFVLYINGQFWANSFLYTLFHCYCFYFILLIRWCLAETLPGAFLWQWSQLFSTVWQFVFS